MKYFIPNEQRRDAIKLLTALHMQAQKTHDREFARDLKRLLGKMSINTEDVDVKVKQLVLLHTCLIGMLNYSKDKTLSEEKQELRGNIEQLVNNLEKQVPQCVL